MSVKVDSVTFTGYNHPLKKAFKKGLLPTVRKGIYGFDIYPDTVSLEHGKPVSKGGKTETANLFLADCWMNSKRGVKPFEDFVTKKMLADYLTQFIGVKNHLIDGQKYIDAIMKRWWNKLK